MIPIRYIREKLVQNSEVIDLECVCARLEHHELRLTVSNNILSDCGDKWMANMYHKLEQEEDEHKIQVVAPTLRAALLAAMEAVEKKNE